MSNSIRQALMLLPIAALLIALGYWNIRPESFDGQRTTVAPEASVDFYVVNPHTQQFKEDGSLNYQMKADKLEHIKATDITLLNQPDLLLYRQNEAP